MGQEARLICDRSVHFALRILLDLFKHYRGRTQLFREFREIRRLQARLARFEFFFCFVEPILYPPLLASLKHFRNFVLVKGVCSSASSGPEVLRLARASLGHSIIETKPNLSGETVPTWNFNFESLLRWVDANARRSPDDRLILRMNAEGVEKDIIATMAALDHDAPRVDAMFGSLGDIKKCFGEDALRTAEQQLTAMKVSHVYFTSSPKSWRTALMSLEQLLVAATDGPGDASHAARRR
jgi:hypothetical protein